MTPDLPQRLRDIAETVDDWNAPITAKDDLLASADELEKLRSVLENAFDRLQLDAEYSDLVDKIDDALTGGEVDLGK